VLAGLRALGPTRLAVLGLAALALLGAFGWALARVAEPEPVLLYTGLAIADSAAITRRLEALGVPYELEQDGGTILVPADRALRLRLTLAEEGLPRGGSVGYEIFDSGDIFGTSSFVADLNLKRALEGELARTIGAIAGVRGARVHLVLPKRELFRREQIEPSASITLQMAGGRQLGSRQVQGIRHLVAAAVPDLEPERVTVVDERGDLLARAGDDTEGGVLPSRAEEYREAYESRLERRIEDLLERSLGPGRVRAEVTAELDFDQVSTTEETFDPEGQVVRSTQTIEEETELAERDQDEAVTVAGNLPTEDAAGGAARTSNENTNRAEETINYEISRTVTNHTRAGGRVRRLSVAVLVDGTSTPDENGELVYAPRPAEEIAQIGTLVRSAIGFDAERGDVVEVINMPFSEPPPIETGAGWLDVTKQDLFRLGEILTLCVVTLLLITMVFRPALKQLQPPVPAIAGAGAIGQLEAPPEPAALEPPEHERVDLDHVDGLVSADLVRKVGQAIDAHPEEVTGIIRTWLHET
jgi:flagellar M-ring protein FliF